MCPSTLGSLTAWTKAALRVGEMLLPALFGVSLRSWRGWHERIQALGLVPLLPQCGEQAEAPSLHFPLRGYQKLRTRQELNEAGCQQGCSQPRDVPPVLEAGHGAEKAARPLAGPVSLIHTLSDGGSPKGCEGGN